jgi:hypothetical protein
LRQVEHDAWCEATLGDTQQQAQRVKTFSGLHERQPRSGEAPGASAGEYPATHADPLQQPQAGPLHEDVADEKDADAEAIGFRGEPQLRVHLQRREADVRAVHGAQEQQCEQRREQPQSRLPDRSARVFSHASGY